MRGHRTVNGVGGMGHLLFVGIIDGIERTFFLSSSSFSSSCFSRLGMTVMTGLHWRMHASIPPRSLSSVLSLTFQLFPLVLFLFIYLRRRQTGLSLPFFLFFSPSEYFPIRPSRSRRTSAIRRFGQGRTIPPLYCSPLHTHEYRIDPRSSTHRMMYSEEAATRENMPSKGALSHFIHLSSLREFSPILAVAGVGYTQEPAKKKTQNEFRDDQNSAREIRFPHIP